MGSLFRQILTLPQEIKARAKEPKRSTSLDPYHRPFNDLLTYKLSRITQAKKIITCHDLIAIRTAKGEFAQAPKTSKSGRRLQNWISDSLHHADYYACDSRQTLEDLNRVNPLSKEKSSVIHLGTEPDSSQLRKRKTFQNSSF